MKSRTRLLWILSLGLAHVASADAVSISIRAPELDVQESGWTFYNMGDSPEGGTMGWLKPDVASLDGVVPLPEKLGPGAYYVFVKGINYKEAVVLQVSCGGAASPPMRPKKKGWTGGFPVRVNAASDELTITLLKRSEDLAQTRKFLLRGIYITDNPEDLVDPNDTVIKASYPTMMDDSPASKGNLIPNGGFEAGFGHGWGFAANRRDYAIKSLWRETLGRDGRACLKLPRRGRLVSRVLRVKPNKLHTLSLWAKPVAESASLTVRIYNVHTGLEGLKPMPNLSKTLALKSGWQRVHVSGYLKHYPTNEYQLSVSVMDNGVWIDELQLEEGELSAYRAKETLEIGLLCDQPNNIFFEDNPIRMRLLAYNSTREPMIGNIRFEIFDVLNRKVEEGAVRIDTPAKTTWSGQLDVSTGKRGIFRIVIWTDQAGDTEEEVVYCVVPRPRVSGLDEGSMIGIHANASQCQYEALNRLGVKWQRVMSPAAWFRWKEIEPVKGQFVWCDAEVRKTVANGLQILGTIGTNDFWPVWADRGGLPDLDEWEKSVFQIVDHYKSSVKYWEIWNEPIYQFSPSFYAQMLRRAAGAIRRADPEAKIVGMGGSYKCDWCLEVMKELNNEPLRTMDYVSTHLYPRASDPLNPSDGRAAREFHERISAPHRLDVWNTETGAWCLGFHKGPNSSFRSPGEAIWPHQDGVRYYRGSCYEAERVACNFLHSIGNGFTRYFYYDSRFHASPDYYKTHPTIIGFDDTIRAKGVVYAVLAFLFDHSRGLGDISPENNTFAYLFDRGGTPVVGLWSADGRNKKMTLKLASARLKAYDMMGNPLTTDGTSISYGRQPAYLEGKKGLAIAAARSAIRNARIVDAPDKTPPNISISDGPRGSIDEDTVRIRWIAIDETAVPANVCPDAILYSYRLRGHDENWSSWTAKTWDDFGNLDVGQYRFEVKAKDAAGNVSDSAVRTFWKAQGERNN